MYDEQTADRIRTVSEINAEIRTLLERNYRFVRVRGEVSNLRQPFSGHCYFTLKDKQAQISGVLFKAQQRWLARTLENGQEIIVDGRVSVYEPRGQYQIIVDTVDFDGTGGLQIRFEQLKQTLKAEGLFDTGRKKELPPFVDSIVLITSPTGAAVHDFITACRRRRADVQVLIIPVRVQGEGAAADICQAIETAHTRNPDVIALCRGGGSIEDLWAFNEEQVARSIAGARIPIVTGIGHETDVTIADFCADVRGATPTAAAELLAGDTVGYLETVRLRHDRMRRAIRRRFELDTHRLHRSTHQLARFDIGLTHRAMRLDGVTSRLRRALELYLQDRRQRHSDVRAHLLAVSPEIRLGSARERLKYATDTLIRLLRHGLENRQSSFRRAAALLDSLSPLSTLARGYAIVTKEHGRTGGSEEIVKRAGQVNEGERIQIRLHRGSLGCEVRTRRDDEA